MIGVAAVEREVDLGEVRAGSARPAAARGSRDPVVIGWSRSSATARRSPWRARRPPTRCRRRRRTHAPRATRAGRSRGRRSGWCSPRRRASAPRCTRRCPASGNTSRRLSFSSLVERHLVGALGRAVVVRDSPVQRRARLRLESVTTSTEPGCAISCCSCGRSSANVPSRGRRRCRRARRWLARSTSPSPSPDDDHRRRRVGAAHDRPRVVHREHAHRRRVLRVGGQRELRARRRSATCNGGPRLVPKPLGVRRAPSATRVGEEPPQRAPRGPGRSGRSAGRRGRRIAPHAHQPGDRRDAPTASSDALLHAAGRARSAGRPTPPIPTAPARARRTAGP